MSDFALSSGSRLSLKGVRPLRFFEEARLQAYGYTVAIIYVIAFVHFYRVGAWILDAEGAPAYTEFTTIWVTGIEALRGGAARLYDSTEFLKIQAAVLGNREFFYPNWPYPPTFLLIAAPFGALPYFYAFLAWGAITLLGFVVVIYSIVRRLPAIALALACPFTAWNFLAGQNGFLTGALLGAGLLCLERRPILAGVFIGCLTYKPQFGILFPVALIASRQWRTFAAAAITAAVLAGISIAAFGLGPWQLLPEALLTQNSVVLFAGGQADGLDDWGRIQTVYGIVRLLHGGAGLASLLQAVSTLVFTLIVWIVWRSAARHALKAAVFSAAALIATPYAFSYDLAAIAVPVAFLVADQLRHGLLRGEQTVLLALFGGLLAALVVFQDPPEGLTFGSLPLGPVLVIPLLALVVRRLSWGDLQNDPFMAASALRLR
jgi:arabinofuranan 3-O-arabinosyltransferase